LKEKRKVRRGVLRCEARMHLQTSGDAAVDALLCRSEHLPGHVPAPLGDRGLVLTCGCQLMPSRESSPASRSALDAPESGVGVGNDRRKVIDEGALCPLLDRQGLIRGLPLLAVVEALRQEEGAPPSWAPVPQGQSARSGPGRPPAAGRGRRTATRRRRWSPGTWPSASPGLDQGSRRCASRCRSPDASSGRSRAATAGQREREAVRVDQEEWTRCPC